MQATMLDRLHTQTSNRQPHPKWKSRSRSLAICVGFACFIGAKLDSTSPLAPNSHDRSPRHETNSANSLGSATLAEELGRSLLYVRCHLTHVAFPLATYTVVYPIYGNLPEKTFTIDLSFDPADVAAREAAGAIPGSDMIIELHPIPKNNRIAANAGLKYQKGSTWYLADKAEAQILHCLTDGSAFDLSTRYIAQQLIPTPLAVRAQLIEFTPNQSKWKIIRVLKGDAKPQTLILDNQFFRQRASAIVASAARKQNPSPTTQPIPSQIDAETTRLTNAELLPHIEAILFIDQVQSQPDALHGRLRYRAYNDNQNLDKLERAITHPDNSTDNEL
jgi:hypothetical protein